MMGATCPMGNTEEALIRSKRTGSFRTFFRHHAVILSNGKIAVDSVAAVPFIQGTAIDPYDASTPCPPPPQGLCRLESARGCFELLLQGLERAARLGRALLSSTCCSFCRRNTRSSGQNFKSTRRC